MSDFMKWLYANYIKPHLDTIPKGDYKPDFYLLEGDVSPETCGSFSKTQEFTAAHAFLLGLRTGQGLSDSLRPGGMARPGGQAPQEQLFPNRQVSGSEEGRTGLASTTKTPALGKWPDQGVRPHN